MAFTFSQSRTPAGILTNQPSISKTDISGTLFLTVLLVPPPHRGSLDSSGYARRVHPQMPGDLRGRQAKLFPAPIGNLCPGCAHLPPFLSSNILDLLIPRTMMWCRAPGMYKRAWRDMLELGDVGSKAH